MVTSKARFPFKRNALRALCKRKPQETQALALASSQSWLPLLRPSIPIGWRLRLLREIAFLTVFVQAYATHTTQVIAFEWNPGFNLKMFKKFPLIKTCSLLLLLLLLLFVLPS